MKPEREFFAALSLTADLHDFVNTILSRIAGKIKTLRLRNSFSAFKHLRQCNKGGQ